jgi:hypothetical protein
MQDINIMWTAALMYMRRAVEPVTWDDVTKKEQEV